MPVFDVIIREKLTGAAAAIGYITIHEGATDAELRAAILAAFEPQEEE